MCLSSAIPATPTISLNPSHDGQTLDNLFTNTSLVLVCDTTSATTDDGNDHVVVYQFVRDSTTVVQSSSSDTYTIDNLSKSDDSVTFNCIATVDGMTSSKSADALLAVSGKYDLNVFLNLFI